MKELAKTIGLLTAGKYVAIVALIMVMILFIIAIAVFLIFGVFSFFGMIFLLLGIYLIIINRGHIPVNVRSPVVLCFIIGFVLILLGMTLKSLNLQFVDFSTIPQIKQLHQILVGGE